MSWDYTTWLNIVFLILAAALIIRFTRTGGPAMLRMMGGQPEPADAPSAHAHPTTPGTPTGHAHHTTPGTHHGTVGAHHGPPGTHHGPPGTDAGAPAD